MAEPISRHILQIIPASGWYAIFNDAATGEQYYDPLVCWALVAEGGRQAVKGLVAIENRVAACEEDPQFSHYTHQEDLDTSGGGEPL